MTEPEAAAYLNLRPATIATYRRRDSSLRHHARRVGRRVVVTYDQADLDAWNVRRISSLGAWNRPRSEDEPPHAALDALGRRLASQYAAAEARVAERMALARAVTVEPHLACHRLRHDLAGVASGLDRLERRQAEVLSHLTPAAIDARAAAAREMAQDAALSRHLAMVEWHSQRRTA